MLVVLDPFLSLGGKNNTFARLAEHETKVFELGSINVASDSFLGKVTR
jgi:hypothetical protein